MTPTPEDGVDGRAAGSRTCRRTRPFVAVVMMPGLEPRARIEDHRTRVVSLKHKGAGASRDGNRPKKSCQLTLKVDALRERTTGSRGSTIRFRAFATESDSTGESAQRLLDLLVVVLNHGLIDFSAVTESGKQSNSMAF